MSRLPILTAVLAGCATAPVATLPDPLPETLEWARPARAEGVFLGIEVRENDSGSLEALSFEEGVRVVEVVQGSPAAAAGVAVGDVVLGWDGVRIDAPSTLDALLAEATVDGEHELEVRRGDSVFQVVLRTEARASAAEEAELVWRADPARSRAGWRAGRGGVVLVTQDPEGPFALAGIAVGSVVTALDGRPVHSERALIRDLQARPAGAWVDVRYRATDGEGVATVSLHDVGRRVTEASLPVLAGFRQSVDGERASFYLIDLWFISLFRYRRDGGERTFRVLRFIEFSTGVGELVEEGA